ncbi:hypothetical protein TSTA_004140 [Talaromyces stipitatus ATCC 10500]|uniref:Uncharacterized protein n=1 Tax=Talaromyces stipitatus (strain ATCC 10500 / CBS 375.48 / QM 6759 / NRRL 1006) TaxID=441959 RepID=B8MTB3_TALSN|nr:uncharacterized protein TSTA_004140 [Talaromyces stipitatus ATCC 10500]EED12363.1 hypothetical protein TSTA_004140 [Talaromyces stipitatus ATCC 10500]
MAEGHLNHVPDLSALDPSTSNGYPIGSRPPWRITVVPPVEDLSGPQTQSYYNRNSHPSSNATTAVVSPPSQGLLPGQYNVIRQVAAGIQRPPESQDTSTDPNFLSPRSPSVITWDSRTNSSTSITECRRGRGRRRMTSDEKAHQRALKAAGGACDRCRKRKKKCLHKESQLRLGDSAQAEDSLNVNNTHRSGILQPRSRADVSRSRRVVPGPQQLRQRQPHHHQRQNHSLVPSNGRSAPSELSISSPSEGGTTNTTILSIQSDATSIFDDERNLPPRRSEEEQFRMDTIGLGQQFGERYDQFVAWILSNHEYLERNGDSSTEL